jgi:phage baseplate assembly protein V
MSDWALSEHERVLANLIRLGTVSEVDAATARVKVQIGDDVETDLVHWAASRAGSTRKWSCPSVGEQVLVFCPFGDLAQAIPALSLYQDAHPAPSGEANVERVAFPDGSLVEYDSASHTLTVSVSAAGNVIVNAASVVINSPQTTLTGHVTVQGLLNCPGGITATGQMTHNGINIGSTHTHGGVEGGSGATLPPG